MKEASLYKLHNLQREVERRCEKHGITVSFDSAAETAYSTPDGVTFPTIMYPMSEDDYILYKWLSIHEPIHHIRSEVFTIQEKSGIASEKFHMLHNILEDEAMEKEWGEVYLGDKIDMGKGYHMITERKMQQIKDIKEEALKEGTPLTANEEKSKIFAVQIISSRARSRWDKIGTQSLDLLEKELPSEVHAWVDKMADAGWVDKFADGGDSYKTFDKAKELYKLLFDIDPEDEPPPPEDKGEGKGKGDGASGDKVGDEESKSGGKDDLFREISWRDITHSPHQLKDIHDGGGQHISWDGKSAKDHTYFIPYPPGECIEKDYSRTHVGTYKPEYLTPKQDDIAFSNRVRRLIQVRTRAKFEAGKLTGRLHNRNIHRIAMPLIGDGEWNRRIFKKRVISKALDTSVTILTDWSGSMNGSKKVIAVQCTTRLNQVFEQALRIPMELLAFSWTTAPVNCVIKPFSERKVTSEQIATRFHAFSKFTGGNGDADALLFAAHRLRQRREKRKILIVLSDGAPTDAYLRSEDRWPDADLGLKIITKELRKSKDIELYGIGIKDRNVKRYYGDNARVVKTLSELNGALFNTLNEALFK